MVYAQGKYTSQASQHRSEIIESLRLEKTSEIIKSSHYPNTTMPAPSSGGSALS